MNADEHLFRHESARMIAALTRVFAEYPFYPAALGELELRRGRREVARGEHFRAAVVLARSPIERRFLERRVAACDAAG